MRGELPILSLELEGIGFKIKSMLSEHHLNIEKEVDLAIKNAPIQQWVDDAFNEAVKKEIQNFFQFEASGIIRQAIRDNFHDSMKIKKRKSKKESK